MYPEFIAIYIMLAIILIALGVIIFFLIRIMKDSVGSSSSSYFPDTTQPSVAQQYNVEPQQYQQPGQYSAQMSVVYCRQCATQYDASNAYCPNCGARR